MLLFWFSMLGLLGFLKNQRDTVKKFGTVLLSILLVNCAKGQAIEHSVPIYLYKIVSPEFWQQSQEAQTLLLTDQDRDFIHLSRDDQLERIIEKFWNLQGKPYIVLKLDVAALPGTLKFEANRPGGDKCYHLYNGRVPLEAVVEVNY